MTVIINLVKKITSLITTVMNSMLKKIICRIIPAKEFFHSTKMGAIIGIGVGILIGILIDWSAIKPTLLQIAKEIEKLLGLIIFVNLILAFGTFVLTFITTWIHISEYLRRDKNKKRNRGH